MTKIGDQLFQPEEGWKRYDDKHSSIKYIGEGWSVGKSPSLYKGSNKWTSNPNNEIRFNFIGTKLRLIVDKTVHKSTDCKIIINGVEELYNGYDDTSIQQVIVYEKIGLDNKIHTVTMKGGSGTTKITLDAIDIDEDGRLLHPDEVTDPQDLAIGKRIRCHYNAIDNQVGVFSELGEETNDFIPPESSAAPNGDFYFICVDKDHLGRWKLIADRNIQHSISWDTLNSTGIASGSGRDDLFNLVPQLTDYQGSNGIAIESSYYSGEVPYYAWRVFDRNQYSNKKIHNRWSAEGVSGQWVGYKFDMPTVVNTYSLMTMNSSGNWNTSIPKKWRFEASNDDLNWIVLHEVANQTQWTSGIRRVFKCDNKDAYRSYRIFILDNNGDKRWVAIYEIEFGHINHFSFTTRLLTGGISPSDKDNEWDKYIVNSDLNGTIVPGDNTVWNWDVNLNGLTSTTSKIGAIRTSPAGGLGSGDAVSSSISRTNRSYAGGVSTFWFGATSSSTELGFRPVLLIEPKNRNKSFILYEDEAYYYNDGWVNLGAIPDNTKAKKQLFEEYGMEHDITGQQLKEFKKMLLVENES